MFDVPTGISFGDVIFFPKAGIFVKGDRSGFELSYDDVGNNDFNECIFAEIAENRPVPPDELILNSTSRCEGRCKYCYKASELNGEVEHTLTFDAIAKYLRGVNRVSILGGEPLLNTELIGSILAFTDLPVTVSTGLFVGEETFTEFMSLCADYPNRMRVQISMDPFGGNRSGLDAEHAFSRAVALMGMEGLRTNIRATLCTGVHRYWELRSDFENALGREVDVEFEFSSVMTPTVEEWREVVEHLMDDVLDYLKNKRDIVPLEVIHTAAAMRESIEKHPGGWALEQGCSTYRGSAIVIEADGKNVRCCMPPDQYGKSSGKCKTCSFLRVCGMRCTVKAGEDYLCMTSTARGIAAAYLIARTN